MLEQTYFLVSTFSNELDSDSNMDLDPKDPDPQYCCLVIILCLYVRTLCMYSKHVYTVPFIHSCGELCNCKMSASWHSSPSPHIPSGKYDLFQFFGTNTAFLAPGSDSSEIIRLAIRVEKSRGGSFEMTSRDHAWRLEQGERSGI